MSDTPATPAGDRLAKVIARSGLCSRRDAEDWIREGRVAVNGKIVKTPAFNVTERDQIKVDGEPLAARQGTRVWLYHKPPGLVVTEKDPEGRPTIFDKLGEEGLPRVVTIGRLDINTEGLLLLTNDGGLKRVLELPATGWLRRYRVRAFGTITQAQLDRLKDGIEVDGIKYGPIEATLERQQGSNVWLLVALREGKNREVKNVLATLGLQVNRLIRVSYGPFQLGDLPLGGIETVKARVLRDQLGKRLAEAAGADFDSDMPEAGAEPRKPAANPKLRAAAPGKAPARQRRGAPTAASRFRFIDGEEKPRGQDGEDRPRRDRPGRYEPPRKSRREEPAAEAPARRILFDDGRPPAEFRPRVPRGKGPPKDGEESRPGRPAARDDDRRPRRTATDRPGAPPRNRSERPRAAGAEARPDRKTRSPRGDARPDRKSHTGRDRTVAGRDRPGASRGPRGGGPKPSGGSRPSGGKPRKPRA